jgi:putative transposase
MFDRKQQHFLINSIFINNIVLKFLNTAMKFSPNEFYHVYNRGNNKQIIFLEEENYRYFIQKINKELPDFVSLVAYCLMPNHYHLMLYIKSSFGEEENKKLNRKLGTLQNSYTRAFNKRFGRTGSLFQQKLKNKILNTNAYHAQTCFHYIHQNPLKARLVESMDQWEFSSYNSYLTKHPTSIVDFKIAYDFLAIPDSKEMFIKESLGVINFDDNDF